MSKGEITHLYIHVKSHACINYRSRSSEWDEVKSWTKQTQTHRTMKTSRNKRADGHEETNQLVKLTSTFNLPFTPAVKAQVTRRKSGQQLTIIIIIGCLVLSQGQPNSFPLDHQLLRVITMDKCPKLQTFPKSNSKLISKFVFMEINKRKKSWL